MIILDKWLKKNGLKSFMDLNEEEKKTFRQWENTLSGKKLTDADVKEFFEREIEETVGILTTTELKSKDDNFLKAKLLILRKLRLLLLMPEMQAKELEQTIQAQINKQ